MSKQRGFCFVENNQLIRRVKVVWKKILVTACVAILYQLSLLQTAANRQEESLNVDTKI